MVGLIKKVRFSYLNEINFLNDPKNSAELALLQQKLIDFNLI